MSNHSGLSKALKWSRWEASALRIHHRTPQRTSQGAAVWIHSHVRAKSNILPRELKQSWHLSSNLKSLRHSQPWLCHRSLCSKLEGVVAHPKVQVSLSSRSCINLLSKLRSRKSLMSPQSRALAEVQSPTERTQQFKSQHLPVSRNHRKSAPSLDLIRVWFAF